MVESARAAIQALDIWLWPYVTYSEGNDVIYEFDVQTPSYFMFVGSNELYKEATGNLAFELRGDETFVNLYSWPLGTKNWNNSVATTGLISLDSFEQFHVFTLSSSYNLDVYASCVIDEQTGGRDFKVEHYLQVQYYDADGVYLGLTRNAPTTETHHAKPSVWVTLDWAFSDSVLLNPPANAKYFTFHSHIRFVNPYDTHSGYIHHFSINDFSNRLFCSVDATAQQLLNELDGLKIQKDMLNQFQEFNEKATVIIEGNEDMQDAVSGIGSELDDIDQQLDDFRAQEDDILSGWSEDNSKFQQRIMNFIHGIGWSQLSNLLACIFADTFRSNIITTVMLLTVAFFNLSVVIFGR